MKTLYVIALMIACGISLAAQERVLTEAEYFETVSRAEKTLYGGTHGPVRQIMETEVITEGQPDYRLKSVALIAPGRGTHRIEDRSFGGKPTKTESITVEGRSFTRNLDGTWKETGVATRSGKTPEKAPDTSSELMEKQVAYKYLGSETYGDRKVHVYTRSETRKSVNKATGGANESETVAKVFIGTDGSYLRQETNTKNSFTGKSGRIKILIEVQTDPTITITPPEAAK